MAATLYQLVQLNLSGSDCDSVKQALFIRVKPESTRQVLNQAWCAAIEGFENEWLWRQVEKVDISECN